MNAINQIVTSICTINGTLVPVVISFDQTKLPNTVVTKNGSTYSSGQLTREFAQAMGDMAAHRFAPRCRMTVDLTIASDDLFDEAKTGKSAQILASAVVIALAARN